RPAYEVSILHELGLSTKTSLDQIDFIYTGSLMRKGEDDFGSNGPFERGPAAGNGKVCDARQSDPGARGEERDVNSLKMKFCRCPPGTFRMGNPSSEPEREKDEGPARVTLSRGFWMGKYEVTQSQWQTVMGTSTREQR